jgi:hypothetical protein
MPMPNTILVQLYTLYLQLVKFTFIHNMSNTLKENLIALSILLISVFVFCSPVFDSKHLDSHDVVSWKYYSKEALDVKEKTGEHSMWSNSQFGGMPTYTFLGTGKNNIINTWLYMLNYELPSPLGFFIAIVLCYFVLVSAFKWRWYTKTLAVLALVYTSYNPILMNAGHESKFLAIAFFAAMLGSIFRTLNGRVWLGAALLTLFTGLFFTSNHYQIIYYGFVTLGIMGIALAINAAKQGGIPQFAKQMGIVAACVVLGMLPSLPNIAMTQSYTSATMRGGTSPLTINKTEVKKSKGLDIEYAFRWSNGWGELLAVAVPGLYGPMGDQGATYAEGKTAEKFIELGMPADRAGQIASQMPDYWGPQPFISGSVYFGAAIMFLFILSLFVIPNKHKWWMLSAIILFAFLSLGKNFAAFNNFLFNNLPMYNKFRTPSMALTIPQILVPLMAVWGLHRWLSGELSAEAKLKALKWSSIATLGLFAFIWMGCNGLFNFSGANDATVVEQVGKMLGDPLKAKSIVGALVSDRAGFATKDTYYCLLLALIAMALLWGHVKYKIGEVIVGFGLIALVAFDLISVGNKYLPAEKYIDKDEYQSRYFTPRGVDNQILADKDPYFRVHDISTSGGPFNDAMPAYWHKLVGGYSPSKMEAYQDLIDVQISKSNKEVFNMLNTKYFILGQPGKEQVMPNMEACGNAWYVNEVKYTKTADEEMLALNAPSLSGDTNIRGSFKALNTAIINDSFKSKITGTSFIKDSSAQIKLKQYGLNKISFTSSNNADGLAVFSDIFYNKGWQATIDGKPADIIRANYILRALAVPKGNHEIVFEFNPPKIATYNMVSNILSIVSALLIAFGLFQYFKKEKNQEPLDTLSS